MTEKPGPYKVLKEAGTYRIGLDLPTVPFQEIGKHGVRRYDGHAKASGKALYTRDVLLPGMLYVKVLASPYAHGKIIRMDTSKAEVYPGVRAVLRYDDLEIRGRVLNGSWAGPKWVIPETDGWILKPVHLILGDEAFFEGQMVGVAICADSEQIAAEALKLVAISWQQLPFVLDQEEALNPGAPILTPDQNSNQIIVPGDPRYPFVKGSVEKGFQEADKVIEIKARRNAHLWAGAELPCVIVRWCDDKVEMWVHEQQPYMSKALLSEQLGIPMNKIRTHSLYQGCSFGERCFPPGWSQNGINTIAALLARKVGKPVKLVLNRAETFYGESGDIMVSYTKVGAKKDGTITAVHMKNVAAVLQCTTGADHLVDNTRIANITCEGIEADVSKGPTWWCRCEQLPNAFCQTMIFDHVADALGLDPTEVALKNDGCEGHDLSYLSEYKRQHGFPNRDSLKECIEAGKRAIGWEEKWHPPGTKRLPNGRFHGIGFTWSHNWDDVRGTGSAGILIQNDGTVSIIAQHSDIGTNPWTAYMQIVADELGVRYEDVEINPFDLNHGLAMMSPDGSCNLISNGFVLKKAAQKAKNMLLDLASEKFGVPSDALDVRNSFVFEKANPQNRMSIREILKLNMPMNNSVVMFTEPPILGTAWHNQGLWGQAIQTGRPRLCRQAHFVEVEVDPETGEVLVTNVVNVNDVGKAISPESVEGQMYGGTYMGLGRALTEEMIWDPLTGVLLNRNLLDYKYATMLDYPGAKCVYLETGMGHGPYGSVGIGEDTATMIPALLGPAVYNAIGKRVDDFPITPDKVLKALGKI